MPRVVQHFQTPSSASNITAGTDFVEWPNKTLAGNALALEIQTDTGPTGITITDDAGNTYTVVAATAGGQKTWFAYKLGAAPNAKRISLAWATSNPNFISVAGQEVYGCAATGSATLSAGDTTNVGTVQAGTISPTAGDFVVQFGSDDTATPANGITGFVAGTDYQPLAANRLDGMFVQVRNAAPGGSINPTFTVNGSSDNFLSFAASLPAGKSGTLPPPGVRVFGVHQFHIASGVGGTSHTFDIPTHGNLLHLSWIGFNTGANCYVTAVSDDAGGTWSIVTSGQTGTGGSGSASMAYAPNLQQAMGRQVTITLGITQTDGSTIYFYDITNALPDPLGATGDATGTQSVNADLATSSVTPQGEHSVLLNVVGIVSHATNGIVGDALYDSPGNANEDGGGNPWHQDNGWAHRYNGTDRSQFTFTYGINNNTAGVGGWASKSVEYKGQTGPFPRSLRNALRPAPFQPGRPA